MKREVLATHSLYDGLNIMSVEKHEEFEEIVSDSELDRIIREIFTVDENTGLPKGDLAYFLSKDGNPQIKDWLVNNLLMPRSKNSGSSVEGVTDDLIQEFSRRNGEDIVDYSSRLDGYYQDAMRFIDETKRSKEIV